MAHRRGRGSPSDSSRSRNRCAKISVAHHAAQPLERSHDAHDHDRTGTRTQHQRDVYHAYRLQARAEHRSSDEQTNTTGHLAMLSRKISLYGRSPARSCVTSNDSGIRLLRSRMSRTARSSCRSRVFEEQRQQQPPVVGTGLLLGRRSTGAFRAPCVHGACPRAARRSASASRCARRTRNSCSMWRRPARAIATNAAGSARKRRIPSRSSSSERGGMSHPIRRARPPRRVPPTLGRDAWARAGTRLRESRSADLR